MRNGETTWLVIADRIGARILAAEPMLRDYRRVAAYRRDESGKPQLQNDAEAAASTPGQPAARASLPVQGTIAGSDGGFARAIGASLNRAAARHRFKSLVLIAPSRTLSELVGALDSDTLRLVKAELVQDLTRVPDRDLSNYLRTVSGA